MNKVETGVRVIHIPTGTVTQSTEERSQFQNKLRAMERMREKLAGLQQEQQNGRLGPHGWSTTALSGEIRCGLTRENGSY